MTKLKHYDHLGTARFVTFSCYYRLPSLSHPGAKEILIEELDRAKAKHGFRLLPNKDELLRRYWDISQRQIETSVVLGLESH